MLLHFETFLKGVLFNPLYDPLPFYGEKLRSSFSVKELTLSMANWNWNKKRRMIGLAKKTEWKVNLSLKLLRPDDLHVHDWLEDDPLPIFEAVGERELSGLHERPVGGVDLVTGAVLQKWSYSFLKEAQRRN